MRIYNREARMNGKISLSKEQQRHAKVLRLKEGEIILVFDGLGNEYEAVYSGKVSDQLNLDKKVTHDKEAERKITLMIAAAKGNRMDTLVEKATELGVIGIVPIVCERSVVEPGQGKIQRWRKIAVEACCQSGRNIVPIIEKPLSYEKALEKVSGEAYICDITGQKVRPETKEVTVLIGPEGGFTEKELKQAVNKGIRKIKLSNSILRIETAGIAAVAQLAN